MRDHANSDDRPPVRRLARYRTASLVVIALTAAAAFGAVDQYLGGRYTPFLTAVSGMSAPWLLLPFIVGAFQPTRRRAAVLGLCVTWMAVSAYVLMIVSPMEGAQFTVRTIATTAASQWLWFGAGLISGPLYGILGHYWHTRRSWPTALLATIPVMLEPAARWLAEHFGVLSWSSFLPAVCVEVMAGLVLTVAAATAIARTKPS